MNVRVVIIDSRRKTREVLIDDVSEEEAIEFCDLYGGSWYDYVIGREYKLEVEY